jgi:nucleoside-triphosphatase THEP1
MSITIKENEKPKLMSMETICDNGLHEKLNKYELTRFLNKHSTNMILGRPGSGKSSFVYSLFRDPLRKVYNHIYYFCPKKSMDSVKNNIFEKLPDNQIYHELTYENLSEVLDKIQDTPKNENNCIIMDDQGAYLKDKETKQLFKMILMNKRHLSLSLFVLQQTYFSIDKDLRRLFDNFFVYKVNKNELYNIFEELIEHHKDKALEVSKIVYDKPYQFLFIHPDSQKLYKGFDELIFSDT